MKFLRRYYIIALAAVALCACNQKNTTHEKIRQAVERQMEMYPKSTLRDLYKNFFQDRFGPGHLIADPSAADKFLRHELESAESFEGVDYEPTGYEGRFYRVNLGVIADGRVPYEKYFDAFIRSVNGIKPISLEQWHKEWNEIVEVIRAMNLPLDNLEDDIIITNSMITNGSYVMHHSRSFNAHYQPHYRIIEREIFEQEILPLLNK